MTYNYAHIAITSIANQILFLQRVSDSPQPQIDPATFFVPIPEPGKGVSAFVQVKLLVEYQFVWFSLAFQRDGA